MKNIALIFNTIRYLKPVQIYGRLIFKVYRPGMPVIIKPDPVNMAEKKLHFPEKEQSFFPPHCFKFLNQSGQLTQGNFWNDPGMDKLWLYNLHYFDDLNAVKAVLRRKEHSSLMDQWIVCNSPGKGNGWEPYPISLRVVNWIKWALQGNSLSERQLLSLFQQTSRLFQRLEYHLLGNHLIANAKALVFAGLFFEGSRSDKWLNKGVCILVNQINEQILDDGGHFERSPMYHAIILEDILDLIQVARAYPGRISTKNLDEWRKKALKMVWALEALCHPDGNIAFFNDAAMKIALHPAKLVAYAGKLGIGKLGIRSGKYKNSRVRKLSETGYVSLARNRVSLIVDAAPLGPDYLPAHAHADTLSFELSIGKQRVFVNSGTSCYGTGMERLRQRKTAAHNTLTVDGQDSSEVWSGFRVAKRAKIGKFNVDTFWDKDVIEASHDGFGRFKKLGFHHRRWTLSDTALTIEDRVEGTGIHLVCLYFHFHPLIEVISAQDEFILMNQGNGLGKIQMDPALDYKIYDNTYHPEFGKSSPSKMLVANIRTKLPFECLNRFVF